MEELQIKGRNAITTILHDYLGVRKVSARWIPHRLSDEQKDTRMEWCKFMFHKFRSGESKAVSKIVTVMRVGFTNMILKQSNSLQVWLFPDEVPPQKVKRARSAGKQMVTTFVSESGHIATITLME